MAASPNAPNTVYASGQNRQGTLFYAVTKDFGDTWQIVDIPGNLKGIQVNDLVVVNQNGMDMLLFGTNSGFFRIPVVE